MNSQHERIKRHQGARHCLCQTESVVQKGGAGPEGSGRPVLSLCESGEPRESAGVTAERWSQLWCKKAARVQKVPAGLFCLCVRAGSLVRALG